MLSKAIDIKRSVLSTIVSSCSLIVALILLIPVYENENGVCLVMSLFFSIVSFVFAVRMKTHDSKTLSFESKHTGRIQYDGVNIPARIVRENKYDHDTVVYGDEKEHGLSCDSYFVSKKLDSLLKRGNCDIEVTGDYVIPRIMSRYSRTIIDAVHDDAERALPVLLSSSKNDSKTIGLDNIEFIENEHEDPKAVLKVKRLSVSDIALTDLSADIVTYRIENNNAVPVFSGISLSCERDGMKTILESECANAITVCVLLISSDGYMMFPLSSHDLNGERELMPSMTVMMTDRDIINGSCSVITAIRNVLLRRAPEEYGINCDDVLASDIRVTGLSRVMGMNGAPELYVSMRCDSTADKLIRSHENDNSIFVSLSLVPHIDNNKTAIASAMSIGEKISRQCSRLLWSISGMNMMCTNDTVKHANLDQNDNDSNDGGNAR